MLEFTSSQYTLQGNKTINSQVVESGELVKNGRYFSLTISHSIWCVTPMHDNIKTVTSLITSVKSDISVSKIKFVSGLPPCIKTIKQR